MIIGTWIWLYGFAYTCRKIEKKISFGSLSVGNYAEIFCIWPYYLSKFKGKTK